MSTKKKSEPTVSMRQAASKPTITTKVSSSKADREVTTLSQAVGRALDGLMESKPPKVTKTYGRLAEGYVQLNVSVRPEVKERLVKLAKSRGLKLSESVDEILGLAVEIGKK